MDYERNFIYRRVIGGNTMFRKLLSRAWAEFQQRSFTFKLLVPLLGGLILVFLGFLYYSNRAPASMEEDQPAATASTGGECGKPGIRKGWCLYENAELGFSFEYPEEWGGVDFEIVPGEDGTAFTLAFETQNQFPRSYLYTTDWSQAESAWDKFAYYRKNEDGTYNLYSLGGDVVTNFKATKEIELFHGIDEVLIVGDEEAADLEKNLSRGEGGTSQNSRYAFANFETQHNGNSVTGLKFVYRGILQEEEANFDSMVYSLGTYQPSAEKSNKEGSVLGYAVSAPSDWVSTGGGTKIVWVDRYLPSPDDDETPPPDELELLRGGKIWIQAASYPQGASLLGLATKWVTDNNYQISSVKDSAVSGVAAVLVNFDSANISGKNAFFNYNNRLYQIGLAIYDFNSFSFQQIESYVRTYDKLVASFVLLDPGLGAGSPGTIFVEPIE